MTADNPAILRRGRVGPRAMRSDPWVLTVDRNTSRGLFDGGDRGVACLLGGGEALLGVLELAVELGAQFAVGV